MIQLFRKTSLGISSWRIWADGDIMRYSHALVHGGSEVHHEKKIELNQSGRNLDQQMQLEINSRISRMKDKGYKHSIEEAKQGQTNQLGLVSPMLALPHDKVKLSENLSGAYFQQKFDGHRCLVTRQNDELLAYSRQGKFITTVTHVLQDLDRWLPEGVTLDGELFRAGVLLQDIGSFIKRAQAGTGSLQYWVYDHVAAVPYEQRLAGLQKRLVETDAVRLVPTTPVTSMGQAWDLFAEARRQGMEGGMLRLSSAGYEPGKRSRSLIKLKEWQETEVTVLGATPSKDGWAILRVRTDWNVDFDISAPGTIKEKMEVMENIADYIGDRLTIEYAALTADKVPHHASALRWREDI